jgi:septal ring factor EnvC (AmiA/AmiB activator)
MQSLIAASRDVEADIKVQKARVERENEDLRSQLARQKAYVAECEQRIAELDKLKFKSEFQSRQQQSELEDKTRDLQTKRKTERFVLCFV